MLHLLHLLRLLRRVPGRGPALLIALALALVAGGAPAFASGPVGPQLSIAVDNGRAAARPNQKLAYTITVTNLGTKTLKRLTVSQTVPVGSSFVSADSRGRQRARTVTWSVDVKAQRKVTVHSALTVASGSPDQLLRLATVACAQMSAKGPPVVCSTDSDQLPAGAEQAAESARSAAAASIRTADSARSHAEERNRLVVICGLGLLAAALGAGLLRRRRRRG
jgi:uncharacterized repeat protein (TIGR01451 family)